MVYKFCPCHENEMLMQNQVPTFKIPEIGGSKIKIRNKNSKNERVTTHL
jgi:hypothetical protein